jgi:hypothetical protein
MTLTSDEPQIIMSYAATTTSTAQGHSRTTPFSTIGTAEELQTGQLTMEVIRLCKKVETAGWEVLTWGRELKIGLLIGRLGSGLSEGQTLQ